MNGRLWTKEDVEYLERVWETTSYSAIARRLNRSPAAVSTKASSLRLRRDNEFMSVDEVAGTIGVHHRTIVIRWIGKYGLPCKKSHYAYQINYDDLMNWLRDHPDLWSAKHLEPYALGTEPAWLTEKRKHEQLPKGGSPWTTLEKSKAVMMYRRGATNKEIGAAFGRTEESARKLLYRVGAHGGNPTKRTDTPVKIL